MPGRMTSTAFAAAVALTAATPAVGADLYLRIVDVGNGLCVIGRTPEGHTLLYDAGYGHALCASAVAEIIGLRSPIDVMVLSHSDQDHIGDGSRIVRDHTPRLIIHPGDTRRGETLKTLRTDIQTAELNGATVVSMANTPKTPFGATWPLGSATLTLVAGWNDGAQTQAAENRSLPPADQRNALSVVIRLDYGGHSVLLTGDTIGRRGGESGTACRNAERLMSQGSVSVKADILIGQHHGGDNGTSNCFIRAVKPTWVIFSAGRGHGHPRQAVADRLVANGVDPDRILRTDRDDDEGEGQWVYLAVQGCKDPPGDDDVEVFLADTGAPPRVGYRAPRRHCPTR